MLTISDIMQRNLITLQPTDTLVTAIDLLVTREISGVPVVTADRHLVGLVTEFTLTDVLFDPALKQATVAEFMTSDVHTINQDDSLTLAIQILSLYRIRRLPVVRGKELIGIVARRDLLRHCLTQTEPLSGPLDDLFAELQAGQNEKATAVTPIELTI